MGRSGKKYPRTCWLRSVNVSVGFRRIAILTAAVTRIAAINVDLPALFGPGEVALLCRARVNRSKALKWWRLLYHVCHLASGADYRRHVLATGHPHRAAEGGAMGFKATGLAFLHQLRHPRGRWGRDRQRPSSSSG